MQLKADLLTDRLVADTFREMFLQHNKPWLRSNVQEILTPRILFAQRKKIIEELGKVLGDIEPDVNFSKTESSKSSVEENDSVLLKRKQQRRMQRWIRKFGLGGQEMTRKIAEGRVTPTSRSIIKYWVMRMRFIRKLRIYAQQTISVNIAPECLFCRYQYGLQVELL
jgi:hypothetical protein